MCGESLDVPPYNLKEAYRCNDPVEKNIMQHKTQEVDKFLQRIYVLWAMDLATW